MVSYDVRVCQTEHITSDSCVNVWVRTPGGSISAESHIQPKKKFAGPWPRACQITGLWILTMSNILFLQLSSQTGQFEKQKSTLSRKNQHQTEKINIEPQLLQLLLLLLLLLLKLFLVPGARGAVREPPDPETVSNFCGG